MKSRPTKCERVIAMIESAGFSFDDDRSLTLPQGVWRHSCNDCNRWQAFVTRNGLACMIGSWDTVTLCARYGITITRYDDRIDYLALAKVRPPRKKKS